MCRDRSASKAEKLSWLSAVLSLRKNVKCQHLKYHKLDLTGCCSPAAVGFFRASSSIIVAVRYFVSYLYLNVVSSGKKAWESNDLAGFIFCDRRIINCMSKSPSTVCSSSCVCVSGTFFCCSDVTVPRANTTSTSALKCSCKIRNNVEVRMYYTRMINQIQGMRDKWKH